MSNELAETNVQQLTQEKTQLLEVPSLDASLKSLAKAGGFDFLESVVDGANNLNPVRKAKRNIFLTDATKKEQKSELKKKLNYWIDLLNNSTTVSEMVDKANTRAKTSQQLLKKNLWELLHNIPKNPLHLYGLKLKRK